MRKKMREFFGAKALPLKQISLLTLYQFAFLVVIIFLVAIVHFFTFQPEGATVVGSCIDGLLADARVNSMPTDRHSAALQSLFSALPRLRSEISSLSQFAIPFAGISLGLALFLALISSMADREAEKFFDEIGRQGVLWLGILATAAIFITLKKSSFALSITTTLAGPLGVLISIYSTVGFWCLCSFFILEMLARNRFAAYVISPKSDLELLGFVFIFSSFGLFGGLVSYFLHTII